MKLWLKPIDILIILLAAGLTVFSAHAAYMSPNDSRVLVQGQEEKWIFPLNVDETITVKGPLGETVVRINENSAWVESSPCQNQTCVVSGKVRRTGSWSACLPNNVLLMLEGNKRGNDADAVTW